MSKIHVLTETPLELVMMACSLEVNVRLPLSFAALYFDLTSVERGSDNPSNILRICRKFSDTIRGMKDGEKVGHMVARYRTFVICHVVKTDTNFEIKHHNS